MTTAQTASPAQSEPAHAAPSAVEPEARVLLSGIEWETYERLRDELDRSGCHRKLTYDGGDLEIEMPSQVHELIIFFLVEFLSAYMLHRGPDIYPIGGTTQKRKLLEKGLEPDLTYYVSNADKVSQKGDQPIEQMPPPDLAIEVEVTVPFVPKLSVYAAIGVPELWHVKDEGGTRILQIDQGEYVEVKSSGEFPGLTSDTLSYWIRRRLGETHAETVRAVHQSLANVGAADSSASYSDT